MTLLDIRPAPAAGYAAGDRAVHAFDELRSLVGALEESFKGGGPADAAMLSRDEFLAALAAVGDLQDALDVVKARLAGQTVERQGAGDCHDPVLVSGHGNAASLLAELWRIALPAARTWCSVGEAITPRRSLLGESLGADDPVVAGALGAGESGSVSVDQAAVIVRELTKCPPACSREDRELAESLLVEQAGGLTVDELRKLAVMVRNRLDQDGVEPREAIQRRRRSLTISTTHDGLTHLDWYLDPVSAGFVVSAIEGRAGAELRVPRFTESGGGSETGDGSESGDGPDSDDETRTLTQLRSDVAVEIFRHASACETATVDKASVTMIVRVPLAALTDGVGTAEIDGIAEPISAGAARRLAADARIIPMVLGDQSEVLDLGRSRRLFSRSQKLALAERDGGCAWPGCPHPPGYTEAHHIRWWDAHAGPTDLGNGILLCSRHHHRVHDDGWHIDVEDHVPWFTPPDHLDPRRRRRRGGRVRLPEAG